MFFSGHMLVQCFAFGFIGNGLFAGGFDFDTIKANSSKIPSEWMSLIILQLW
jgi:hypothetical protein